MLGKLLLAHRLSHNLKKMGTVAIACEVETKSPVWAQGSADVAEHGAVILDPMQGSIGENKIKLPVKIKAVNIKQLKVQIAGCLRQGRVNHSSGGIYSQHSAVR